MRGPFFGIINAVPISILLWGLIVIAVLIPLT